LALFALAGCGAPHPRVPTMPDAAMRDRAAIDDTIHAVARGADLHQWDRVRAAFAPSVELDYGTPEHLTPDQIVARWQPLLSAFDASEEVVAGVDVEVGGAEAHARSAFHATHVMRGAAGGDRWLLAGRYEYAFANTAAGWKITRMRMIPGGSSGNAALLE